MNRHINRSKDTLSTAGERKPIIDKHKSMTPADKEQILNLAKTKTIKEISGTVGFDMEWVACVVDALMKDINRKTELTKNFF